MDGQLYVGQRTLTIEFQIDRHAQDRLDQAYQRVEAAARLQLPLKISVQAVQETAPPDHSTTQEIQG